MEDVRYGRDWVERLDQLRNMSGVVGLIIGAAFALVAVVIIGVTIRLTILQRAREIAIMRVVGATNWFIRGPFLLEGALKGVLGGLLALRARVRRVRRCSAVPGRSRRPGLLPPARHGAAGGVRRAARTAGEPAERRTALEGSLT